VAALRGSCLCGGVKFEVTAPVEEFRYCHCESCKKLSGGAATANARVPREAIQILEGNDLICTYQPAAGSLKSFCSTCGSNLFGGGWPESPVASVRVTTLDDPFNATPVGHIFVGSVAHWETLPDDGLKRFETRP
jgi:hypothetical protein